MAKDEGSSTSEDGRVQSQGLQGDDDFAYLLVAFEIPVGFDGLIKGEGPGLPESMPYRRSSTLVVACARVLMSSPPTGSKTMRAHLPPVISSLAPVHQVLLFVSGVLRAEGYELIGRLTLRRATDRMRAK